MTIPPHDATNESRAPRWAVWVLLIALLIGLTLRIHVLALHTMIEIDGVAYAQLGVNWIQGKGYTETEGTYRWYYPPFYPVQIGLASLVIGDPDLSGCLVSLIYGLAISVSLFYLGRRVVGWQPALLAAVLALLHPRFIDVSVSVLAESTFIALYFCCALIGYFGIRKRSMQLLLVSGILGALAFLTKPAAVPLIGTIGLWLTGLAILERWGVKKYAACVAAFSVPVILLSLPWLIHLHDFFGRWTTSELVARNLPRLQLRMANDDEFKEYILREDGLEKRYHAAPSGPAERLVLGDIIRENPRGFVRTYWRQFKEQIRHLLEGLMPLRAALLAGMFVYPLLFWRNSEKRLWGLFSLTMLLPLLVFPSVYVSLRYVLPLIPFIMLTGSAFILAVADRLGRAAGRPAQIVIVTSAGVALLALVECALFVKKQPAVRGNFDPREFMVAGKWLKEEFGAGRRIMAYSPQMAYYAEGESVVLPHATPEEVARYARHREVEFVAVDERFTPKRRKPAAPLLDKSNAPEGFELIYDATPQTAQRIVIYRLAPVYGAGTEGQGIP